MPLSPRPVIGVRHLGQRRSAIKVMGTIATVVD
jgi:hypothetical protein